MLKILPLSFILFAAGTALYADTPTLYFDSISGTYGGHAYSGDAYGGPYYLSPYFGHTSTSVDPASYVLFCLDFDHYINIGDSMPAVFRSLTAGETFASDGSDHFQYGSTAAGSNTEDFINGASPTGADIHALTSFQRYEAAIYLLDLELTAGPTPPAQISRSRAVYQYAIWALFLQNGNSSEGKQPYAAAISNITSNANDPNFAQDVNSLILAALNEVTNHEAALSPLLSFFTVVDATSNPAPLGGSYQEFLHPNVSPDQLPSIPEPASVVLLGTVFAGIAFLRRRQRLS